MEKSNKKKSEGTLYIVPTPIGNLKDITLRSIEVLKGVNVIYAEDTRVSRILLNKLEISTHLKSCHLNNESIVKHKIVEEIKSGKDIALISDQGTPLLSDPGYEVVLEAIDNDINIVALPGASALLPALNMSGIEANKFLFFGFLNSKNSVAKRELDSIKNIGYTVVIYESPHRFKKTLETILEIMGDRNISVVREITKLYEETFRGKVSKAIEYFENIKGEIVIVIEKSKEEKNVSEMLEEINLEKKKGLSNKDAVRLISKKYGVSKNLLYNKNEEINK